VNHKAKMIQAYLEETQYKNRISYITEQKPLGTAGSLRQIKSKIREPFIVTNCDIIIKSDIDEIVRFHKEHGFDMTLVVSCRHYIIPYGVCEIQAGGLLKGIIEKPAYELLVNTGMYVMNTKVLEVIPANRLFNMDNFIGKAKGKGFKIGVFPISEHAWIDIGQWEEYHKVLEKITVKS
jgi:NDP-sugar pyrophosphorylase family protein